jgi:hypothetical protein
MIRDEAMPDLSIRKIAVLIEEIHHEGGPPVPRRRGVAMTLVASSIKARDGLR